MMPRLEIYRHVADSLISDRLVETLLAAASEALPDVLSVPEGPAHVLADLSTVEISIVSDAAIADVHAQFLDDDSPTDVITFPHGDGLGEIIVSVETALKQAAELNEPWERELFRYIIHGLIHLQGYLDATPEQRDLMFSHQEPIVLKHWPTTAN